MPRGEARGFGMAEEQAAQHTTIARHDRQGEIAAHRQMPVGHALARRVAAIALVTGNVVGAHDAQPLERRREDRGVARHREAVKGLARHAGQGVQAIAFAIGIDDIVEEGAEGRARQFDPGVGDELHQTLQIMLLRQRRADAVERFDRALRHPLLGHILARDGDAADRAAGIAQRHPIFAPDADAFWPAGRRANHFLAPYRFTIQNAAEKRACLLGQVGDHLGDAAPDMRFCRGAVPLRQHVVDADIAQVGIQHGQADGRGLVDGG